MDNKNNIQLKQNPKATGIKGFPIILKSSKRSNITKRQRSTTLNSSVTPKSRIVKLGCCGSKPRRRKQKPKQRPTRRASTIKAATVMKTALRRVATNKKPIIGRKLNRRTSSKLPKKRLTREQLRAAKIQAVARKLNELTRRYANDLLERRRLLMAAKKADRQATTSDSVRIASTSTERTHGTGKPFENPNGNSANHITVDVHDQTKQKQK